MRHVNLSPRPKEKNADDLKKHEDIYLVPVLFFDDTSIGVYVLYIHTNFKNTHTHTHTHTHTQSEHMHTGLFHFHCRRSKGTYQTHRNQEDTAQMHPTAGLICNAGFPTVLTFDEAKQSMTMSGTKLMPADATFAQVVDFTHECARAPSCTSCLLRARSISHSPALSLSHPRPLLSRYRV